MKQTLFISLIAGLLLTGCGKKSDVLAPSNPTTPNLPVVPVTSDIPSSLPAIKALLADPQATNETAALFYNMKLSSKTGILFGHQDANKQGYTWSNSQGEPYSAPTRSDVYDVTGAYPVVYGHDLLQFIGFKDTTGWFLNEKNVAKDLTKAAYDRGGINTYSWHYDNPVTKNDFYDVSISNVVAQILPGGAYHGTFKKSLQQVGIFFNSLKGSDGKLIPILFRPFHEFDGNWFWWGKNYCTPQEYKSLYQFTVEFLRDSMQVHNVLYAWSPDKNFTTSNEYLERYPGDAYVDLVGSDNYGDLAANVSPAVAAAKYKLISDYAIAHKKIAAITETGLANVTKTNWYTDNLLKVIKSSAAQLSYVLLWSNARGYNGNPGTYWAPYTGAPAATIADFNAFKNDSYVKFSNEVTQSFYSIP